MTGLQGAHLIVTGGSEGIGLATARLAAARGARISLIARRPDVLAEAAAGIRHSAGASVATANADVSDEAEVGAAIATLTDAHGPCDVLLCCAGYSLPDYFDDLPSNEFERSMAVNYLGTVHAVRAVLPSMRERRRGHILVTSSTAGIIGVFGLGSYSPTKFALRGLAEVIRAEVVADGIRVGIVYPPDTETPGFGRENLTKPAETAAVSGSIAPITAEHMATKILNGIERNRFQIFADPTTAALARTSGLMGPLLRWQMDRTAGRAGRRA